MKYLTVADVNCAKELIRVADHRDARVLMEMLERLIPLAEVGVMAVNYVHADNDVARSSMIDQDVLTKLFKIRLARIDALMAHVRRYESHQESLATQHGVDENGRRTVEREAERDQQEGAAASADSVLQVR